MNNLDPEVAERPADLVVYGGTGKAARNWEAFDVIVRELMELESDETLLVQSGKAVGRFRTHEHAPRVLIANSNLVGKWATWDEFRRLEADGPHDVRQMTAGSWIYIGTQGILQGTYETFVAAGRPTSPRDRTIRPLEGALDPHRGPRRHGRRAAARGDHGGRLVPRGRGRSHAHRAPPRDALRRRVARRSTRRSAGSRTRRRPASRSRSALLAQRR
jgi:hypothetical protein